MNIGKLYGRGDENFVAGIEYKFYDESPSGWWGEFITNEYKPLHEGEGYVIELEDGRKGECSIRKRINRATAGIPTLYYYYFWGKGLLK
jgi:hypothetical protein